MAMRAGFTGLGHLGKAIAGRLKSQCLDLAVWNRAIEKGQWYGHGGGQKPS